MTITADTPEEDYKFLVRELNIMMGEDCKMLSLHYIHKRGEEVEIFPFDRERAGYEYKDTFMVRAK